MEMYFWPQKKGFPLETLWVFKKFSDMQICSKFFSMYCVPDLHRTMWHCCWNVPLVCNNWRFFEEKVTLSVIVILHCSVYLFALPLLSLPVNYMSLEIKKLDTSDDFIPYTVLSAAGLQYGNAKCRLARSKIFIVFNSIQFYLYSSKSHPLCLRALEQIEGKRRR